jgi:hypothetical protein
MEIMRLFKARQKYSFALSLILSTVGLIAFTAVAYSNASETQPRLDDHVCATRFQLRHPERCASFGPGSEAQALARKGLYPPKPLPISSRDPSFEFVPYDYLRVSNTEIDLYPDVQAAASGSQASGRLARGFVYLSYSGQTEQNGIIVYQTNSGFVRGGKVSRITPPSSPGLVFYKTPERTFGWTNAGGVCTQRTPGGVEDYTDNCYTRHSIIQVYDVERVGDWDWYMVAEDEWIEQRWLSLVTPDPNKPEGVEGDRWIAINLYEQTVAAYVSGELVYATITSTGRYGFWTQPGTFQVWAKMERDLMTGGVVEPDGGNYYYLEDVPWVLYFDQSRALHGTYWHAKFGTPTSRGCVNLAPADARWIYEFAEEGTWVHVFDPSGNTPTDPEIYGPGGA